MKLKRLMSQGYRKDLCPGRGSVWYTELTIRHSKQVAAITFFFNMSIKWYMRFEE